MYKLCRTNNTTLARHAKRRHDGNLSEIDVQPYLGSSETVRKARMHCEKHCSKDVLAVVPSSVDPASSTSEEKRLSDELEKSAEVVQPVDAPVPAKKQIGKVQTTLAFEGQAVHGQPVDSLHSKIDTLMKEVKELKLQVNCKKPGPSPLMAVDRISHEETALLLLHWRYKTSSTWFEFVNMCNFFLVMQNMVNCQCCGVKHVISILRSSKEVRRWHQAQWLLQGKVLAGKVCSHVVSVWIFDLLLLIW